MANSKLSESQSDLKQAWIRLQESGKLDLQQRFQHHTSFHHIADFSHYIMLYNTI